jgi:hypothetical protein
MGLLSVTNADVEATNFPLLKGASPISKPYPALSECACE